MLPAKRKPTTSGILRGPKREWPKHRAWVRKHMCCVPGCDQGPIEFAHVRTGTDGGTSLKPNDIWGISLCREHHAESHQHGEATFQQKYRIDLKAIAAEFAAKTTDLKMKEAMGVVQ